jgi:hypothetical protein
MRFTAFLPTQLDSFVIDIFKPLRRMKEKNTNQFQILNFWFFFSFPLI